MGQFKYTNRRRNIDNGISSYAHLLHLLPEAGGYKSFWVSLAIRVKLLTSGELSKFGKEYAHEIL